MSTVLMILAIIFVGIGSVAIYGMLSNAYLSKLNVNKWIILVIVLITLLIPAWVDYLTGSTIAMILSQTFFLISVLWFVDESGLTSKYTKKLARRRRLKNDVEIRPKAKPNRVKHMKK